MMLSDVRLSDVCRVQLQQPEAPRRW